MYGEITSTCPTCDHEALPAAVEEETGDTAALTVVKDVRTAPKPFVQTDAFKYIMWGGGALTLGLVFSACTSGKGRPAAGNPRGRR
jgi:hypothetical protein